MGKRAATAAETRQRLVEATFELHTEQGIAATTMKQIAERADVSVGTAYHHFPSYDDAVRACGAYTFDHFALPGPDVIVPGMALTERLVRLADAYFAYYERVPAWEHARSDQAQVPALREFVKAEEDHRRDLVQLVLAPDVEDESVTGTVAVLLDHSVFRGMRRNGFSRSAAAQRIAEIASAWIARHQTTPKQGVKQDEDR